MKMWFSQQKEELTLVNLDLIYKKFDDISKEKGEEFIAEDPSTKSNITAVQEIVKIVKKANMFSEVNQNISDDVINLIEVACKEKDELFGILLMNKHCYIQSMIDNEPLLKRSVELKHDILQQLFGWTLLIIDQQEFMQ